MGVRIAYLFSENRIDEVHRRIENSINYIFFMGFGCMFGIMGIARNFVPLFFGQGYEPVVTLLYIFSPIIVIIGVSNCLGSQYYTPVGKRAQSAKFLIVGSCVNLILNFIMIPRLASYGAAIASICAELVITILYIRYSEGYMKCSLLLSSGWKKCLSGFIMFGGVYFIGNINVPEIAKLVIQISLGGCMYILALVVIRDRWTTEFIEKYLKVLIRKLK